MSAGLTQQSLIVGSVPFGSLRCNKIVAFNGGAGTGAVGTVALFTVTGGALVTVVGVCTEDLTEAGATATISVGTAASPTGIIAQINAVNLDTGELWIDNTPAPLEAYGTGTSFFIGDGADIILTVGAQNVTDGTVNFVCFWTPLTATATVVPS
jgi:hypothetical protein